MRGREPDPRWNPWRALRDRPQIELGFAELHGRRGMWQRDALGDVILLDVTLSRRERRSVLAHELVHAERGIGHGVAPAATMELEERIVSDEATCRLVPQKLLRQFIAVRSAFEGITAVSVADEFDIDEQTARHALELLRRRGAHPGFGHVADPPDDGTDDEHR